MLLKMLKFLYVPFILILKILTFCQPEDESEAYKWKIHHPPPRNFLKFNHNRFLFVYEMNGRYIPPIPGSTFAVSYTIVPPVNSDKKTPANDEYFITFGKRRRLWLLRRRQRRCSCIHFWYIFNETWNLYA